MSSGAVLNEWLEREARASARVPSLDEALVTDRGLGYAAYRLRYAMPRALLRTLLHVIEVVAVTRIFRFEYVAPLIAIRSGVLILGALWWGALEQLRQRVREDAGRRRWDRAQRAIEAWLSYSVDYALLLLAALLAWLKFGPSPFESFSVFDAFAVACVLRAMLEAVLRAYHSGVLALRRVYRPFASVVVPDIGEVVAIVALLPLLGLWSLAIVTFVFGVARAVVQFHYTRRAYAGTRLPQPSLLRLGKSRRALPLRHELGMLRHAAANVATRVDSFLVLALLTVSSAGGSLLLAVTFHLLQPLFASSQRWAGLFYLDFLILRSRHSPFFQRRFARLLLRVSVGIAAGVAALTVLFVLLLRPDFPKSLLALIGVFLVLRSLLGLYQVQAFAYHQHRYLLKLSLAALLSIAIAVFVFESGIQALTALLGLLALTLLVLRPPPLVQDRLLDHCPRLPLLVWLAALKKHARRASWWGSASIERRAGVSRARVMRSLSSVIGAGAITTLGRRHLIWFGLGSSSEDMRGALIVASGGCLSSLKLSQVGDTATSALRQAVDEIGSLTPQRALREHADPEHLCALFRERFPTGRILDAERGALQRLSRSTLRAIVREIDGRPTRSSHGFDVAIYGPNGQPKLVFAMDPASAPGERSEFRALVERSSLTATIQ